jgi:rhamnulokinase
MLWPPFHYRDSRTEGTYDTVRAEIGSELIFAETGIQFMPINTIYHLASDLKKSGPILEYADCFLTIGDYFNYLFSGVPCVDESTASTTQLYNPQTHAWSKVLIERCGFPPKMFPRIVASGTVLGRLSPEVAVDTGLVDIEVVATCSHDTGAAVAAVPADTTSGWAYLSSGTWSLLGVELPKPLINEGVRKLNFTNEAGYGGTTRFLKNIIGLWLLQECRREWLRQGMKHEYSTLTEEAKRTESFRSLIDPRATRFMKPGDMPEKIIHYCKETGQPAPESPGQFARSILESLALLYRFTIEEIEQAIGHSIQRLYIVGGGSQNALLNEFAAHATEREVVTGPVEATAIGNVLIQATALGHVESLAALRRIVRDSFPLQIFKPRVVADWRTAYQRFRGLDLLT